MNKQVVLITGGTRGIGLGIAQALAAKGFSLAVNGMRPAEEVAEVLTDLRSFGVDVIYCRGNIAEKKQRDEILQQVIRHYGCLNILVNNAGIAPKVRADLLETSEESFEELLRINLQGPYFLSQQAAKLMIESKKKDPEFNACIITVSSISSRYASINRGEYCITKAGLSMMTKLFAVRLAEYDIPVYEIQPGIIATDMTAKVKERYDQLFANGLALQQRWGQPEDIGKAAAALAIGDIPYATGQVLIVDGGLSVERL